MKRSLSWHPMDSEQTDKTETSNEPVDSFVGCVKVLLALSSCFALLGWIYVVLVSLGWYGFPRTPFDAFVLFYPFIYLAVAVYCCWVNLPLRTLVMTALLLNLPIAALSVYWIVELGGVAPGIVVCLLFMVLWSLLCVARRYGDSGLNH